jgi:hypothetical protein
MSTTTHKETAFAYSGVKSQRGTVFEIAAGRVDVGASISFLSQYPGEEEYLMQPLCCLEVPLTSLQRWKKAYVAAALRFPAKSLCRCCTAHVLDSLVRDPLLQVVGEQRIDRTPHGEVLISI